MSKRTKMRRKQRMPEKDSDEVKRIHDFCDKALLSYGVPQEYLDFDPLLGTTGGLSREALKTLNRWRDRERDDLDKLSVEDMVTLGYDRGPDAEDIRAMEEITPEL